MKALKIADTTAAAMNLLSGTIRSPEREVVLDRQVAFVSPRGISFGVVEFSNSARRDICGHARVR